MVDRTTPPPARQAINPPVEPMKKPHARKLGSGKEHGMRPVIFPHPKKIRSFAGLAAAMKQTTAGGKDLGKAVDVVKSMMADKGCSVVLTLSGNATPFTCLIAELIDAGIVHAVVSTGSVVTHSFSAERGRSMFQIEDPDATDDNWFYNKGYNRIYDCVELEKSLNEGYDILGKITDELPAPCMVCSAEITRLIGDYLLQNFPNENGLLHACARMDVPLYIPTFSDCEIGLDFHAQNLERRVAGGAEVHYDGFGDWEHYCEFIKQSKTIGIITLGGGVPRNWAQQVGPFYDILSEYKLEPKSTYIRFKYGVRICSSPSTEGGLSGCTYCLHGDTLIDTPRDLKKHPKGIPIRDLVGKSGFPVYSYDLQKKRIVLANVSGVFRSTRKPLYKLSYSWIHKRDGKPRTGAIIASADHQFLMRDGAYKRLSELKVTDRLMPFNTGYLKNGYAQAVYRHIYMGGLRRPYRVPEHRMIAEYMAGRSISPSEHVHHVDHCPWNNSPENLVVMSAEEHTRHHGITAPKEQRERQSKAVRETWKTGAYKGISAGEKNPRFIDGISEAVVREALAKTQGVMRRAAALAGVSEKVFRWRMRQYGIPAQRCGESVDRFIPGITEEAIRTSLERNRLFVQKAARDLGVSDKVFYHRMKMYGIPKPMERRAAEANHIVTSIEYWGEDETFDMTVDGTHNFAANGIITHNSEGRSWGKFLSEDKGGEFAEVVGDYSLAFPLLVQAILE